LTHSKLVTTIPNDQFICALIKELPEQLTLTKNNYESKLHLGEPVKYDDLCTLLIKSYNKSFERKHNYKTNEEACSSFMVNNTNHKTQSCYKNRFQKVQNKFRNIQDTNQQNTNQQNQRNNNQSQQTTTITTITIEPVNKIIINKMTIQKICQNS
jgi:hypothetical protein